VSRGSNDADNALLERAEKRLRVFVGGCRAKTHGVGLK